MKNLTHQERCAKREQNKKEADTLQEYLHYTDLLDMLFSAQGIAATIAMACDNCHLDDKDAQKIAQAAHGIESLLNRLYDAFEDVPPPVYRVPEN